MSFNTLGASQVRLSLIGLGGHEFLPDGRVKAMGEDFHEAVKPGAIWEGFGGEQRRRILKLAYGAGINFFDLTMDSEKEAFARNVAEMPPPYPIFIQTRPEGMVYNNDPSDADKSRLLDYGLLKVEAARACDMLGREAIDCYNFGLFPPAVQRQPGYVRKLADNVERLKADGLIRFACVDTLSGEAISLAMIETGAFDAVFTAFSVVNDAAARQVIPAALERRMGVFLREAFIKGRLFAVGEAAGISDRSGLARAAVRWILAQEVATVLVVGVANSEHLTANLEAANEPALTDEDEALLGRLRASDGFAREREGQYEFFREGFV
ncbi:MAG: aldo/keto reductase [Armatimonadetes bacterium]|nr:aldo/keto reductase [Armatimonadota bacterium]